jgi:hypothetical protein
MLDHAYDPPVEEDVRDLRALVDARLRRLPDDFELTEEHAEISIEEREQLVADFLAAPQGERWRSAGVTTSMRTTSLPLPSASARTTTMAARCAGASSRSRSS